MWRNSWLWMLVVAMTPFNVSFAEIDNLEIDFQATAWSSAPDVHIDDSGVRVTTPSGDPSPFRCGTLSPSDNAYFSERVESMVALMDEDRERRWGYAGEISESRYVLAIAVSQDDGAMSRYRFVLPPVVNPDPSLWYRGEVPPKPIVELVEKVLHLSESTLTPCISEP